MERVTRAQVKVKLANAFKPCYKRMKGGDPMSSPTPPRPRFPLTICKECKRKFNPKRKWQVFCKSKCRNKYWNDRNKGPDKQKKEMRETLKRMHEPTFSKGQWIHPPNGEAQKELVELIKVMEEHKKKV